MKNAYLSLISRQLLCQRTQLQTMLTSKKTQYIEATPNSRDFNKNNSSSY